MFKKTICRKSFLNLANRFRQHSDTVNVRNSLVNPDGGQNIWKFTGNSPLTWYSCGPTVYDSSHLGHARTYVCTDIIRRIMTDYFNVRLTYAMGITDIDDKIINKAKLSGYNTWEEMQMMVRKLENDFFHDMDRLNVKRPDSVLRVTEHIPDILAYIQKLIQQNNAYIAADGVYFDFSSLKHEYDKFGCTNIPTEEEIISHEIHENNPGNSGSSSSSDSSSSYKSSSRLHHKKNSKDFALWKLQLPINTTQSNDKGDNGNESKEEVFVWDSPWGKGRPGWHIECSAMTHTLFGKHINIHSGGVDLKFPHHTNEIAQW